MLLTDEVSIIGRGINGLLSAISLHNLGFTNIVVIGEKTDNICSTLAGAVLELPNKPDTAEEMRILFDLFKETFLTFEKIYKDKTHYLNKDVREVKLYTDYSDSCHDCWGLLPSTTESSLQAEKTILKIEGNNKLNLQVYKTKSYLIDPKSFKISLTNKCLELNIRLEQKKVSNLSEINSRVIFNCAGLGAFVLNNDQENALPICGHGFTLNMESSKDVDNDVVLILGTIPGLEKTNFNGLFYLMPRTIRFVGGTHVVNYSGDNEKRNLEEVTKVVNRAKFLMTRIMPKF